MHALGIAVIASIYATASEPRRFVPGLSPAFLGAAAIALVAMLIAWRGIPKAQAAEQPEGRA